MTPTEYSYLKFRNNHSTYGHTGIRCTHRLESSRVFSIIIRQDGDRHCRIFISFPWVGGGGGVGGTEGKLLGKWGGHTSNGCCSGHYLLRA